MSISAEDARKVNQEKLGIAIGKLDALLEKSGKGIDVRLVQETTGIHWQWWTSNPATTEALADTYRDVGWKVEFYNKPHYVSCCMRISQPKQ